MAIDTIKSTAVLDGAIATADIADDAVTADKLANAINTSIAAKLPLAGGTITGDIAFGDSVKAKFGAGNDLRIYHDGSNSYIDESGTGNLRIMANDFRVVNSANSESMIQADNDGAVRLYYDNATKLATKSTGVDISGAVNSTGEMRITNPSATSQLYLYGAAGQKSNIILNEYGVRSWEIGSGTVTSGQLSFKGAGSEHMRIRSGGQITTGTSQPAMVSAAALHQTSYNSGTNWAFLYNDLRSSSGTSTIGYFYRNGSPVGSIQSSASSVAYNTSSDYRLKENVDYTWDATTRLKQLKPARFNFIADPDTTVDGFLAHEAQSVVPESVHGTKDGMRDETDEEGNVTSVPDMQGIDQSKLVPLLVKTIQELEARITALEDA
jgi:hypothetical protein